MMMIAGGCGCGGGGDGGTAAGGAAVMDHNGMLYSGSSLQSLQQSLMEAESVDSRKRPLESSNVEEEETGCMKRTNVRGKRCTHPNTHAHIHSRSSL